MVIAVRAHCNPLDRYKYRYRCTTPTYLQVVAKSISLVYALYNGLLEYFTKPWIDY